MTREEAAIKLTMHLASCGMLMPEEWLARNGPDSELQQALKMAVDALREQEKRRWISVEERLPNREDADPKGFIIAIDKESNKSKIWWFDIVAKYPQEFTHWMPLPEPPKED